MNVARRVTLLREASGLLWGPLVPSGIVLTFAVFSGHALPVISA